MAMKIQRDLAKTLKRETLLNVGILGKLNPIPLELSRLLFKDNALEKPTQNVFNHLSYYLVTIIDTQAAAGLPWPLYDTKTERTYRNELSTFISDCSRKQLLSPVMSSYFVNPRCYKVTILTFQLSQLGVQRVLLSKMNKNYQKELYNDITKKYKSQNGEGFIDSIAKETEIMLSKFSNYLCKRKVIEEIAGMFRKKITDMEETLLSLKTEVYIDNIVDEYVKQNQLDDITKAEILNIKDVYVPSKFFESWLTELDKELDKMEKQWNDKTVPFLEISQNAYKNTEALIARQTGEADIKTFMIEYNAKTDEICTKDLQNQVNSQQKYIIKNITKDDRLNFPNLIRGFLISICFILKNTEIGDELYTFNDYLDGGRRNYSEIVAAMRMLVERVLNAESRLQQPQLTFNQSISIKECEIPPLPNLSDIKMNQNFHPQVLFEAFTPLNLSKRQFNLRRQITGSFTRPLPKSMLITPFHRAPRDDFLLSVISCQSSAYDRLNATQNMLNESVSSQVTNRGNETIAGCSSGFTKQQICRLLSTKKTSTSKKFKYKTERPNIHVKKGGLFNESNVSNDSIGVIRSHSSPDLFENREKVSKMRARKLSKLKEDSLSLLEVSGIAALERDSNHSTPQGIVDALGKKSDKITENSPKVDLNKEIENLSTDSQTNLQQISTNIFTEPRTVFQRKSTDVFTEQETVFQRKSTAIFTEPKTVSPQGIVDILSKKLDKITEDSPKVDLNKEIENLSTDSQTNLQQISTNIFTEPRTVFQRKNTDIFTEPETVFQQKSTDIFENKNCTPKSNVQPIKKTSSLEKIINRFKRVRASVLPTDNAEIFNDVKTIVEEKQKLNSVDVDIMANRILLPDLLSPSCSSITKSSEFNLYESDEEDLAKSTKKPRESLGTALGVDHTFLDQFDLID